MFITKHCIITLHYYQQFHVSLLSYHPICAICDVFLLVRSLKQAYCNYSNDNVGCIGKMIICWQKNEFEWEFEWRVKMEL